MIWLQPAAWVGLIALAAPILIHLLVHRRSEPLPFPTLRFLQPTRLASLRRHRLDDLPLLLVRAAILAASAAALAGPLLVTSARRAEWNRRVARAIVVDPGEPERGERTALAHRESDSADRSTIIETSDPIEGLRRAAAWLAGAPPARREIVTIAPLAIGAVTDQDVAAVPREIGLRFVRSGSLPRTRTTEGPPVLAWSGAPGGLHPLSARSRTVTLTGRQTSVHDAEGTSPVALPIDIVAPARDASVVDAALAAVIQQGAPSPAPGRKARLIIAGAPDAAHARASVESIHAPWIGDAVARLAADADVASTAGETAQTDPAARSAPWQTIAVGADGAPVVSAAQGGDQLVVASGAAANDLLTPVLIRSMLAALAPPADVRTVEVVPIADAQLRAWERPAGLAPVPDANAPGSGADDDRRWLWAVVIALIAAEGWMRRRGPQPVESEAVEAADRVA